MTLGLIGKKIGMTQKFYESGEAVPVTVLQIEPGKIVDVISDVFDPRVDPAL